MFKDEFIKNESDASLVFENGKFIIKAPKNAIYLSEFMNSLPNGILNKKNTGCGATSVALENNENIIICCPSRQLIKNKINQYPSGKLLGVLEGVQVNDILQYVAECIEKGQCIKIMVTYDSFYKVKEALKEDIGSYKVVVDEYQEILNSISYRRKAILGMLKSVMDLPFVTYLSATPIPFGFLPDELIGVDEYEIDWGKEVRLKPQRIKTNKPYVTAASMIIDHKLGKPFEVNGIKVEQYYFFINSVTAIKSIIENAGLSNDDVKVICANTYKNRSVLDEIDISDVDDEVKPYTFCTKSVFYGADFYSESGLIIIVSECRNKNTMLDIATDIQQIAGRIRNKNNPFNGIIFHIYNTGLGSMAESEFELYLEERKESAEAIIKLYNNATTIGERKALIERVKMEDKDELALYDEQDKTLTINTYKINHMKYMFKAVDNVYKNGLSIREAYQKNNWDLTEAQEFEYTAEKFTKKLIKTPRFKTLYEEYVLERAKMVMGKTDRAKAIEETNELVPLAYQYLLPEELKSTGYNATDIRNIIYSRKPDVKEALVELLSKEFSVGQRYSYREVKEILKKNYDKLKIEIAAKATDLKKYYLLKENVKVKKEDKRVEGIEIIGRNGHFMFMHDTINIYLYAS